MSMFPELGVYSSEMSTDERIHALYKVSSSKFPGMICEQHVHPFLHAFMRWLKRYYETLVQQLTCRYSNRLGSQEGSLESQGPTLSTANISNAGVSLRDLGAVAVAAASIVIMAAVDCQSRLIPGASN